MNSIRRSKTLSQRSIYGNEKGIVLPVALMFLVILSVMGSAAVVFTRTDLKIAANYKNSAVAFNLAEAGVSHAKRTTTDNVNWDALLAASSSICPGLSGCTYTIENDPIDAGGATTDTNNIVIVRAEGQYGNAKKVIHLAFRRNVFPMPPGTITNVNIGFNIDFAGPKFEIDGNNWTLPSEDVSTQGVVDNNTCGAGWPKFGFSVPDTTQQQGLKDSIDPLRWSDIIGAPANPPLLGEGNSDILSVGVDNTYMTQAELESWADLLMAQADVIFDPGTVVVDGTVDSVPVDTGTQAAPKIVAVDCATDPAYDPANSCLKLDGTSGGAGILIVKNGKLQLRSTTTWVGIVIVVGENVSLKTGGGGIEEGSIIYGAALIGEKTAAQPKQFWGVNVKARYSCDAINMANTLAGHRALWWKEVM